MYFTIVFTSALLMEEWAGIMASPQTPDPPLMILLTSRSAAVLSPLYFRATWVREGPNDFALRAWQALQSLLLIRILAPACSAEASNLLWFWATTVRSYPSDR